MRSTRDERDPSAALPPNGPICRAYLPPRPSSSPCWTARFRPGSPCHASASRGTMWRKAFRPSGTSPPQKRFYVCWGFPVSPCTRSADQIAPRPTPPQRACIFRHVQEHARCRARSRERKRPRGVLQRALTWGDRRGWRMVSMMLVFQNRMVNVARISEGSSRMRQSAFAKAGAMAPRVAPWP